MLRGVQRRLDLPRGVAQQRQIFARHGRRRVARRIFDHVDGSHRTPVAAAHRHRDRAEAAPEVLLDGRPPELARLLDALAQLVPVERAGRAYGNRWVIVVDDDIDVSNLDELMWAALTRADPVKDVDFIRGGWNSPTDPLVSPADRARGKTTNTRMIINACRPYHWRDEFVAAVKPSDEMARRAKEKFGWLLD
jgi:hypothetical protein